MAMGEGSSLQVHLLGLACGLFAILLYLNTYNAELVFDDHAAVGENMDLRPSSPWTNLLRHDFWGYDITHHSSHKSYRPICSATYKINYHLHELEPMGYHLGNVLVNALVCYLFVLLSGRVFGYQLWPTLVAGVLYTVHPIHTEAVAGVVGRAELLSSLFFLLAILTYHKLENTSMGIQMISTLLLCLCSFLSKEQGIMTAGVCLSYDLFIMKKMDFNSIMNILMGKLPKKSKGHKGKLPKVQTKDILFKAAVLALFSAIVLVTRMFLMKGGPTFSQSDHPGQVLNTPYRQLYYLHLLVVNAWVLINPSQLTMDYRFGVVPLVETLADYRHILTAVLLISLTLFTFSVVVWQKTHSHVASFALSLTALFFLPSSNLLVRVGFVVAERVLYIPSMGLCLLVSLGAWHLMKSNYVNLSMKRIIKIGLGVLIVSHSIKTFYRSEVWNTSYQLYIEALKLNPTDGLMYSNLGHIFEERNESELAEQAHSLAVKLSPQYSQPYRNYGVFLMNRDRNDEAEVMLRKVIDLAGSRLRKYGKTAETYSSLAEIISHNTSRLNESLQLSNRLVSIAPDLYIGHVLKATYLKKLNRIGEAKLALKKALNLKPNNANLRLKAGELYTEMNETYKAEKSFRAGLELEPDNGGLMLQLGKLLVDSTSPSGEDLKYAGSLVASVAAAEPTSVEAQFYLAMVYFKFQLFSNATTGFLKTLELQPDYVRAQFFLAYTYYEMGNFTEVVDTLTVVPDILEGSGYYDVVTVLGLSYAKLNQTSKAEQMYTEVLQKDPNNLSAMNGLGSVRIQQGRFKEATTLFEQVLGVDTHNQNAQKYLNWLNKPAGH